MKKVKIILWPPSYIERYQIIPIRADRHLFPEDTVYFTLETNLGAFPVRVMEHKGWPPHIHLKKTKWLKEHPELKQGEKLIIEVTESKLGRKYRLLSPKEQKEIA